jgi:hypothetical protein
VDRLTLVDTQAAAAYVARATGRPCSPVTVRRWASKGWLTRRGRAGRRTEYALEDVDELLATRCPDAA